MKDNIEAFIDAVANDDFRAAETLFQELISSKVSDTLDAQRVEVAADLYGTPEVNDDVEEVEEETEQIDELSKDMLKSYVKKAVDNKGMHDRSWGRQRDYDSVDKSYRREKGIATAIDKLAK